MATQPGLVGEVGGGHPLGHPAFQQVQHAVALFAHYAGVQERFQRVQRQVQGVQRQIDRLVPGVVAAVSQRHLGAIQTRHPITDEVTQGQQFLAGRLIHS
ncbi:hypothetical protein G6F65_018847 [Rhizopus arrhizus]|nr:hypothetical protein G6F31_018537 [Rhizopus arrhizus]KAG1250155.1 hypothetical protein G6F65_018847 [Rhizopus arrhizus]KAG1388556.1 hypothetical protein G6F59_015898 [Rhizopus arrhizus]